MSATPIKTVRLAPSLRQELKRLAVELGSNEAALIRRAIAEFIDRHPQQGDYHVPKEKAPNP